MPTFHFNPTPIKHMPCTVVEYRDSNGEHLRACGKPLSEPCPCEQEQTG